MGRKATLTLQIILLVGMLVALLGWPAPAEAATLVLNTTDDVDDGTCNNVHCSLREAIDAVNAVPGPDPIEFDIPGPGIKEIFPPSPLVLIDDGTTIDAPSQPGYCERDERALVPERNPYLWWLGLCPNHHKYGSLLRARCLFITLLRVSCSRSERRPHVGRGNVLHGPGDPGRV